MSTTVASSQGPALSDDGAVEAVPASNRDRHAHARHDRRAARSSGSAFISTARSSTAGVFLTPRNLWNLLVQTSSIAVMATGMVLIIVTRQIDLSVGSILGFIAVCIGDDAGLLARPPHRGIGNPAIWIVTLVLGVVIGAAIGAFHGYLIAYARRSVLHRHARRPAGLARRRLVGDPRRDGRADGCDLPADRRRSVWLDRRDVELDRRHSRLRRHRRRDHERPAPAQAFQVSAAADLGRSVPGVLGCVAVLGRCSS